MLTCIEIGEAIANVVEYGGTSPENWALWWYYFNCSIIA